MKTYLTIITTDEYLLGALTLHRSLMMTDPLYDLLVVVTEDVSKACEKTINKRGINTLRIKDRFSMPVESSDKNRKGGYNRWNNTLSKLLIFELAEFEKIVYLDSDMMVLQNLDHLFECPHMSAVSADILIPGHEHWLDLNSGLMIVEPKSGLGTSIMSHLSAVAKREECFGDQVLLNAHYPDWRNRPDLHLDQRYNVFYSSVKHYVERHGYNLRLASPDDKTIAVVHFVQPIKPFTFSFKTQLKKVLKQIVSLNFENTKVLSRYFWIMNTVQIMNTVRSGGRRRMLERGVKTSVV